MIYSGRAPYGTNQIQSSSLAITVENTDVAVFTTGSLLVSGSLTSLGGFTGSFSGSFTGSANFTTLTSSNALITGNVTVLGTASINTLVINQTQLSTGSNQLGDNVDDFQTLFGTVRIPTGSLTVTGSTIISSSAATQLRVGNNLLFVSSSGNVGIGTTTPNARLEINGDTRVVGSGNTSSTTALGIYNSNIQELLRLRNDGLLIINNSSNVLIGTSTDAGFKLDVNGTGRFSGNLTVTGSATNSLLVKGSGTTSATNTLLAQDSAGANLLQLRDDGSLIVRNASAGNYTLALRELPNGAIQIMTDLNIIGMTIYSSTIERLSRIVSRRLGGEGVLMIDSLSGTAAASAMFEIRSTSFGFLPPRTNLTSNISTPAQGLITYLTGSTNEGLYYYSSGSIKSWTKVLNDTGSQSITGSLSISGSAGTSPALQVYKSGSTVVSIQGSQGELFSITDSLSGSLFSVSNISGLPILEVFSDNTTLIGNYLDPMLVTTQLVTANSGSTTIYSLPTASYDGAFYDYVVRSGSNSRAGQIMAIWSGSSVNYTDNSTTDFGSTANLSFNVIVSGSNMVLRSTVTTGSWTVKTIIRSI